MIVLETLLSFYVSLFVSLYGFLELFLFLKDWKKYNVLIISSLTCGKRSFAKKVKVLWTWVRRQILTLRTGGRG